MSFKKILVKIRQFVTQCRKIAGSHGSDIFSPYFFKAALETYRDHQSLLSSPLLPVKWDVFSENLLMIDVAGTYPNDHFHPTYILYYTIILHYTQMASHWLSKYLIKKQDGPQNNEKKIQHLVIQCSKSNLDLNVKETKEMMSILLRTWSGLFISRLIKKAQCERAHLSQNKFLHFSSFTTVQIL